MQQPVEQLQVHSLPTLPGIHSGVQSAETGDGLAGGGISGPAVGVQLAGFPPQFGLQLLGLTPNHSLCFYCFNPIYLACKTFGFILFKINFKMLSVVSFAIIPS